MIKIKINRKEIDINIGDIFLDNGSVIILMSQKIWSSNSWSRQINPSVPKKWWKHLQDRCIFSKSKYGEYKGMYLYKVEEIIK